jgi:hypothetical protein
MNEHDSLSLQKLSNKVVAMVAIALVVVGFVFATPPDEYLYVAVFAGMVWGTLRCLGFGAKKWQNAVIILSVVFLQNMLRERYLPKLVGFNERMLSFFQFFGLILLFAMFVVWMKEREESKG